MKIGVLLKQVPDTETKIRIKPDGSGIETGEIKWIVNPYDELAVEAGLRLKEKVGGEVVVVSLGPTRAQDALRTALAMGADRAILLDNEAFQDGDSLSTSRALAKVVQQEGFEIVFAGKQALDDDAVQVPQIVAELLDWPHVTNIESFELQGGGDVARVKRGVGGGVTEVIDARLPVVLSCDKGLNEPRYASLPGIMKAKTKPLAKKSPADLGLDAGEVGRAGAVVVASEFHLPPDRPAGRIIEGDLPAACAELVRLLREEAKVV